MKEKLVIKDRQIEELNQGIDDSVEALTKQQLKETELINHAAELELEVNDLKQKNNNQVFSPPVYCYDLFSSLCCKLLFLASVIKFILDQ